MLAIEDILRKCKPGSLDPTIEVFKEIILYCKEPRLVKEIEKKLQLQNRTVRYYIKILLEQNLLIPVIYLLDQRKNCFQTNIEVFM